MGNRFDSRRCYRGCWYRWKTRSIHVSETPRTAANLWHAAPASRRGVCAPRRAAPRPRTRFIGAWPSFGKVSWVNCKCFRAELHQDGVPPPPGGEFVYASWLPTWERQHGARHGLKRTNRFGPNAALAAAPRPERPSVGRINEMACCTPLAHLRPYSTEVRIDRF